MELVSGAALIISKPTGDVQSGRRSPTRSACDTDPDSDGQTAAERESGLEVDALQGPSNGTRSWYV